MITSKINLNQPLVPMIMCATLSLVSPPTWAFQDMYEPDNDYKQAHLIGEADAHQQHTLHSREDEDWFQFYAREGVQYDIGATSAGADVDVMIELYSPTQTLLVSRNDGGPGEEEWLFNWRASQEGIYSVKITDQALSTIFCRINIQYQLQLSRGAADKNGAVQGLVTEATSGKPLEGVVICTSFNKNYCTISNKEGYYTLIQPSGLYELTIQKIGYHSVACQAAIPELFTIRRDIALSSQEQPLPELLPSQIAFRNGDTLRPSKEVYHDGDRLIVELNLHELPSEICARYYFGLAHPNESVPRIITDLNKFFPFTPGYLPFWTGIGNVVIDTAVTEMPRGQYQLYLLRLSASIQDPLGNLDKGELNVTGFRIE